MQFLRGNGFSIRTLIKYYTSHDDYKKCQHSQSDDYTSIVVVRFCGICSGGRCRTEIKLKLKIGCTSLLETLWTEIKKNH